MKKNLFICLFFSTILFTFNSAHAVSILIGDQDGFGFVDPNDHYVSAQGDWPDTDNDGIIEEGEFLPSLNGDEYVQVYKGDDFDNRSGAEASSTNGAQWTDRSLVFYMDGANPIYPANDAFFTFDFASDIPVVGDADYGVDHYINLLFGDYDIGTMQIQIDNNTPVGLTAQGSNQDGWVQLAYAVVPWADMVDGIVTIDVIAPTEPYIALDYAYLNTDHVAPPINPVPEPATMLLLGCGLVGLAGFRRKFKK